MMRAPPPSTGPAQSGSQWRVPLAAWIAAALFLGLLLPKIGSGTLWHHDELLTANRSREMLVSGDPFVVTLNFTPSVKKPPLQYWVCALLLRLLPAQPEFAVRLPTLLAGAGCLLAVAWLAQVYGGSPDGRTATWSALLLLGCGYLIRASRLALLDPGAALFLTLALAGGGRARRDPRWWWFVALQCVLGAWQKAPYALAAWAVILVVNRALPAHAPATRNPATGPSRWPYHLAASFSTAILAALAWWVIQWVRLDHAVLWTAATQQRTALLRGHDPTDAGFRPWLYWFWLARDWVLPGICAPLAAIAALLAWRYNDRPRAALGAVAAVYGAALACVVYRSDRYLVVITPVLAFLTVRWLESIVLPRLPDATRRWVLPLVFASTLPAAVFHFGKAAPARPDLLAIARALGRMQPANERILVCNDAEAGFDTAEFVLFYADLRRPLEKITLPFLLSLPADAGPCRGVCSRAQWRELRTARPALKQALAAGEWVLWEDPGQTAEGGKQPHLAGT